MSDVYVELMCKSNFSFLRGASDSREYVHRALELQLPALGITDLNGVYGLPRGYEAIRDFAPHIKLICGAEVTLKDFSSLTLLVQTRKAWSFLCRTLTQLHAGKPKGEGFITVEELEQLASLFPGANELICILNSEGHYPFERLISLFPQKIYLSLTRALDGLDRRRTTQALEISQAHSLPLLATNSVHYHHPHRRALQDVLVCIREGTSLDRAGFHLFGNAERYLKSPLQMKLLFEDLPEALQNTLRIAESCTFRLSELKYSYPQEAIPPGHSAQSYLKELVFAGAKKRYRGHLSFEIDQQIRRELNFFSRRKEEDYFLTMHDILKDAREKKIVFQGRGSAASSIVCYALGITAVDPISCQLLFDRFANEARPDPPDIDVDFEHERREEVIQGIYSRYGRERAGMVAAVHTYKRAGALREIAKALGVPVGTRKAEVIKAQFKELAGVLFPREVLVEDLIKDISDFPRHLGTHTGGFVITQEPLVETVPIEPAAMDGRTIVQWDKHDLETLGMMKIDILSIGFLTAIRKTTDLIGMDWQDIPTNDPETYTLIQQAKTAGCFQIESRAQMNSLPHTKPSTPYEMTIQVALIRPSMSIGGMSRSYLRGRRQAQLGFPFRSGNPAMDKILGRTFGVAMFPDQIMQMAMEVCGFSSAEADQLRRALGKERSATSVQSQGEKLHKALLAANIDPALAKDILNRTQGFASYGFPEAHAASYGSLAFKSAYLKTHYPAEFLCALINSQPMGFYSIDFLIQEAVRNSQVKILPLHPNKSDWDCKMEGVKTIRMGLRQVARIRKEDVDQMLIERNKRDFSSIEDFISRTSFDSRVLHHLSVVHFFECFGVDRRHSFWKSLEFQNLVLRQQNKNQLSLFDQNFSLPPQENIFNSTKDLEEALIDYRVLGYSLKGSLMKALRLENPHLPNTNSLLVRRLKNNAVVSCAGILLVDQRPPAAKGFGFITLEDEEGTLDLVLRPDVYDEFKRIFRTSRFLIAHGKLQRLGDHITIRVDRMESFSLIQRHRSHQPSPRRLDRLSW